MKPETPAKQVYILRPCMIHGPGNKGNLNLLYHVVSKGIPWPLGSFENKRTFTEFDAAQCSKNVVKIRDKLSVERITKQWIEIIEKGSLEFIKRI